ncbi:MAG: hypothetical protein Q9222_004128 [Ikaeria aurantiellina]
MRLLHTKTLSFHEVIETADVEYAILSHTWGDEEVSFQDFSKPESKQLRGYKKITSFCKEADSHGFEYGWMDTCCIDKSSSAELSEAINSMYRWYSNAYICFVHLNDVLTPPHPFNSKAAFLESRWFCRGWTLQELLASVRITFYDRDWQKIGDKSSLQSLISAATRIPIEYIQEGHLVPEASVAARMSWACHRQTTRVEDRAYSLMGLFDVNMPLLYGEGSKAFERLQHEIARTSEDESLFAWHVSAMQSDIFAPNLEAFVGCGRYTANTKGKKVERPPYTITNRGLAFESTGLSARPWLLANRIPINLFHGFEYVLVPLNCSDKELFPAEDPFTIILRPVSSDTFVRFLPGEPFILGKDSQPSLRAIPRPIYIRKPNLAEIRLEPPTKPIAILEVDAKGLHTYQSEEWYVTPPGALLHPAQGSMEWAVYFEGWTGFAVLQFEGLNARPFTVVIRHVLDMNGVPILTAHGFKSEWSIVKMKQACLRHRTFLDPVPSIEDTGTVRIDDEHAIAMRKRTTYKDKITYTMKISRLAADENAEKNLRL